MPVYHVDRIWPKGRVPYQPTTVPEVREAIQSFHACIGHEILVERSEADQDYVVFGSGGHACSLIGRHGGKQKIVVKGSKFEIIHEICHCLGFEHEQFHPKYLWDDGVDTDLNKFVKERLAELISKDASSLHVGELGSGKEALFDFDLDLVKRSASSAVLDLPTPKIASPKPSRPAISLPAIPAFAGIKKPAAAPPPQVPPSAIAKPKNVTGVDNFIESRKRVQSEKGVRWGKICDYNSIMMYSEWRKVAVEAMKSGKALGRKLNQSDVLLPLGGAGDSVTGLSALDIQAILDLYYRGQPPYRPT